MNLDESSALLFDEYSISHATLAERRKIYEAMIAEDIGPKLRTLQYLQPQGGCFNSCIFCSQDASPNVWEINIAQLRNFLSALKTLAEKYSRKPDPSGQDNTFQHEGFTKPAIIAQGRAHRTGQIFCYLDNDPMSYKHLAFLIECLGRDFGVKTRLSTVGFSRNNQPIAEMHEYISRELGTYISGLRFSVTPYTSQWKRHEAQSELRKNPFALDLANSLKIYRKLLDKVLPRSKDGFSIEIRTAPLVWKNARYYSNNLMSGNEVVSCGPVLVAHRSSGAEFSHVNSAEVVQTGYPNGTKNNSICLIGDAILERSHVELLDLAQMAIQELKAEDAEGYKELPTTYGLLLAKCSSTVWLENKDGPYLCIDGLPSEANRYRNEINIYSKSATREPGVVYRARHLLAAIVAFRKAIRTASVLEWENLDAMFDKLEVEAKAASSICLSLANHLKENIIPLGRLAAFAMEKAEFSVIDYVERGLLWDTGPITNSGRAMTTVFQGLTSSWYEPMSLGEEFGYGQHSASEAGKRQSVLRISPVPEIRPGSFSITAGFRANFADTQNGMMAEELDAFIQPIAGTQKLIPLRVDPVRGIRYGKSQRLLPGVD